MLTNDEDIKDIEKYTFSKYWKSRSNFDNFSQINSFTNNFILNYQPPNNITNKIFNNMDQIKRKNTNSNIRDINYNHININHYQKIPIKKNNTSINNINNLNIINQYKYENHVKNYNNINNINIANNKYKRYSFSKENKYQQRKKYKTPDKNLNYNKFNFITPYESERKNSLYYNESQNSANSNLNLFNKINYNESIKRKINNRQIKKALTPDNTNTKNFRNFRKNVNTSSMRNNDNNIKPINFKSGNKIFNNSNSNLGKQKLDNLTSNYNLNILGLGDSSLNINNKNILNNKYNYSCSIINKTNYNPQYSFNNYKFSSNNSNYSIINNNNSYLKYSESYFNTRLPKGSKLPSLNNKNVVKNVCCNKTPSPIRKNNNYLGNSILNINHTKPLRYTRSSSCESYKNNYSKLKINVFKLNNKDLNCSPSNSFHNQKPIIRNTKKSYITNKNYNRKIPSNICIYNSSCGYNNSSIFDNKTNSTNDKNYNMTQPEFTKSLYNIGGINNKNNSDNNSTKDLYYKYNNKNDSQSYNYKSYIESYTNDSIKDNNSNNWKNEISNKIFNTNKYYYSKGNSNKKNMNSYFTKLSTNNTYDDNSNNSNTSCYKDSKNTKKMDTIEEVHLNFVNILQNTKSMMRNQENIIKDRIIYNDVNSNVIIVEERDIV